LQRAVTEMIAFFQTPHLNVEDVKAIAQTGIEKIASFSRAGLLYAIEQHKVCVLHGLLILIIEQNTAHRSIGHKIYLLHESFN
jgi:uncharacterized membrane protein